MSDEAPKPAPRSHSIRPGPSESRLPAQPGEVAKLAAVDIGSNSVHLVMVRLFRGRNFEVLGRDKEMVRLGAGGYSAHRLTDRAIDEAIAALSRFQKLASSKGVNKFRIVGTSAVREAENGGDFIERVSSELGLQIKIISGKEEGRLIYLAVRHTEDFGDDGALIMDLGGGSLELIAGNREQMLDVESLKLGAGRCAELFLKSDPPASAELYALEQHARVLLAPSRERFLRHGAKRVFGTSGTIMTLSAMLGKPASISFEALSDLYKKMGKRSLEQRAKMPGSDPRRADQIVAGAAVLLAAMETLKVSEIKVSEQALREGIVLNYIDRHQRGLWAREAYPDPRLRTVLHLAERSGYMKHHADQVAKIALSLFDQLQPLHELPASMRQLLEYAAILHDIGYMIGHEKHHQHTEYLIRNGELKGFTPEEIDIIAETAKSHRGARPRRKKLAAAGLSKPDQKAVRRLSAILRIAEGLDRSHENVVDSVAVEKSGKSLLIRVRAQSDAELELWAARRRAAPLEKELHTAVTIERAS